MKKSIFVLMIALMGTLLGSNVMGQTSTQGLALGMPEVLLVSASSTPVSLVLTTDVAGAAVAQSISDATARLKISSVILAGKSRTLTASVSAIPAGTTLTLEAQTPNDNFKGTPGTFASAQTLPTTGAATIITAIGSCYSGAVDGDGYGLKYTWGLLNPATSYGDIRATGETAVTVTVTLTLSAGV